MPKYTSGYLTDDGNFFEDRRDAERHEIKVKLLKINRGLDYLVSEKIIETFIEAILAKYDLTERYYYKVNVPVVDEENTVVENVPKLNE